MSRPPHILMGGSAVWVWAGGAERQAQQRPARLIEHGLDMRVVTGCGYARTTCY